MSLGLTLSSVKTSLGISGTTYDALLTSWLSAAEERIERFCNRIFGSATLTEFYVGTGTALLTLRRAPVTSVTSVYVASQGGYGQGPDGYGTALTAGTDYVLVKDNPNPFAPAGASGILQYLNGVWPVYEWRRRAGNLEVAPVNIGGNVKVVYVAGDVPETVKLAAAFLMQDWLNTYKRAGLPLESEKIGDYSYKISSAAFKTVSGLPNGVFNLVKSYRMRPVS